MDGVGVGVGIEVEVGVVVVGRKDWNKPGEGSAG